MPVKDFLVFFYIRGVNNVVDLERSIIKLNDGFQIWRIEWLVWRFNVI